MPGSAKVAGGRPARGAPAARGPVRSISTERLRQALLGYARFSRADGFSARPDQGGIVILRIVNRGLTPELYEALAAELDLDHRHPLGLIMHGASETAGVIQVAQIWESGEYARRFDEELLRPALEAFGAPLEADITIFELRHLVTP
jgi:hypothetical protein